MNNLESLAIPLIEAPEKAATDKPALPTIEEAKKAAADAIAAQPLPSWASAVIHSSSDRQPVRPYVEKLDNGAVVTRN